MTDLSQVHPEELLQSDMDSSSSDRGPITSYPPRGLQPWVTWGKESRNVFFPLIPYRHVVVRKKFDVLLGFLLHFHEIIQWDFDFFFTSRKLHQLHQLHQHDLCEVKFMKSITTTS